jgi:thiamine transporter
MKTNTKTQIRTLVECAILVALSFVLSFVKFWEMPFGGSVTLLSMLPICVAALRHGPKWGFGTAFVYSITQALVSGAAAWGLTPTVLIVCYLLDYILAFTVLGFCGFFKNKSPLVQSLAVAGVCVLRFICHYLSGVTIWSGSGLEYNIANPYLYSLLYNGGYMLPETIFTAIGSFFVIIALKSRKSL